MKIKLLILFILVGTIQLSAQDKIVFTVQADKPVAEISTNMWGIFFEDINLGADGGMYVELIKNRSFECQKQANSFSIIKIQY
jgi:alpha-L-arabinofuranosidase